MSVVEGRTWLEILSPVACRRHLSQHVLGRVAIIVDGHPEVFPVNYAVDGDDVVFRTANGTKLDSIVDQPVVAFEVDEIDEQRKGGWSVQMLGRAVRVSDAAELRRLRALPLEPWTSGEKSNFVRIEYRTISGRRIHGSHSVSVS